MGRYYVDSQDMWIDLPDEDIEKINRLTEEYLLRSIEAYLQSLRPKDESSGR